jgi:ELWxxDGT repeat protein
MESNYPDISIPLRPVSPSIRASHWRWVRCRLERTVTDGGELWRSNGTRAGTTLVRDIHRGNASSDAGNLTAVGRTLFFTAKDGRHGRELWRAGPPPCAKGKCKKG